MTITSSDVNAKQAYDYIRIYCKTARYCINCIFSNYGQNKCVFTESPERWPSHLDIDADTNRELNEVQVNEETLAKLSKDFYNKLP